MVGREDRADEVEEKAWKPVAEEEQWLRKEREWCQNCEGQPGTQRWWMGENIQI